MADIIDSSQKDSKKLLSQFKESVSEINSKWSKDIVSPLTITLGDEFQGIINNLKNSIEIIFQFEEFILAKEFNFKLRYVLNIGEIETPINRKTAHGMMGEGLSEARKRLNELKANENRFLILLENKNDKAEKILNDSFKIYQYYIDSWKIRDYKIASEFLIHNDYKEIAHNFNLNKSTTWRREKSLNIEEYKLVKEIILNIITVYVNL